MYETMLIVDDIEMERAIIKELMKNQFTIIEAHSGQECLEVVEACKENIDIILLDLVMPNMDGFSVLENRKHLSYFENIPVIVLTASGAMEDQVRAFQLGANDFITKPLISDIIISRVNNVLLSKRRLNSLFKNDETLKVKSELDEMTCLYNKATTEKIISEVLMKQTGNKENAVFIIDIDNFNDVNIKEGEQIGNHTIKIIADLLSSQFRNTDIVGRIGGDRFLVGMFEIPSKEVARLKAEEIVMKMKYKPNLTLPANVTVSIGLAFSEGKSSTYMSLFNNAQEALTNAKNYGKAQCFEYGVEKKTDFNERMNHVVLLSRNRSVCSSIENVFPDSFQVIHILTNDDLKNILEEYSKKNIKIIFVDVSETFDDGEAIWKTVNEASTKDAIHIVALCEECNMIQYRRALQNAYVEDIISVPLETEALYRRMAKIMGRIN